jgi:DNA polymerase-3 subunit chi
VTEVAFHFNAPDPVAYACRLLRKAVSSGARVVVTGRPATLQQLDTALWTFSPADFVPHCHVQSEACVLGASPVVLAETLESVPHRQVLLNLGEAVAAGFDEFERVIEIVGLEDESLQAARGRWRQYTRLGYTITRHDLNLKSL